MRWGPTCAVWATAVVAFCALTATAAGQEQTAEQYFGSPPAPIGSGTVRPTGERQSFGDSDARSVPTGGRKSGRSCRGSRRSRRGRRCEYYRLFRVVRRCTFKVGRRARCRRVRAVVAAERPGRMRVDPRALRAGRPAPSPPTGARIATVLRANGPTEPLLPAVGRLYATTAQGKESSCTGTLMKIGVVLTAAHCVYNGPTVPGPDGYLRVDYFAPGQTWDGVTEASASQRVGADVRRYGYVTAANWWAPDGWQRGDDGQDWALVLLNPYADGTFPGQYTGTHDALVNIRWTANAHVYQVGYPAGGYFRTHFNGQQQWHCDSNWDPRDALILPNSSIVTLKHACTMNGGASGGPTFVQLTDDRWVIAGVNNRGAGGDQALPETYFEYLLVHYFDTRVADFYTSLFGG